MTNRFDSKVIGLDVGLLIGKFFMDTEELHYGYWPDEKKATAQNFSQAQDRHSQLIIDNIPNNVKKILDVGSGSGSLAKKLIKLGYQVDCVIPSEFLAEKVKVKLSDSSNVYINKFEDLDISHHYDLVLFSESFLYVELNDSIKKIISVLNKNGHLLICDVFHKNVEGISPMRGGHRLDLFDDVIDTSFYKIEDLDEKNRIIKNNLEVIENDLTINGRFRDNIWDRLKKNQEHFIDYKNYYKYVWDKING